MTIVAVIRQDGTLVSVADLDPADDPDRATGSERARRRRLRRGVPAADDLAARGLQRIELSSVDGPRPGSEWDPATRRFVDRPPRPADPPIWLALIGATPQRASWWARQSAADHRHISEMLTALTGDSRPIPKTMKPRDAWRAAQAQDLIPAEWTP